MADINGRTINAEKVTYLINYTAERPDNEHMTYHFTITATLASDEFLVVGIGLLCTITVNGSSEDVRIKDSQFVWSGGDTRVRTVSVTCPSNTPDTDQPVTFKVVSDGSFSTTVGVVTNSAYTVRSAPLLSTACEAPTTCSLDVTVAETSAVLSWSGAAGGINNDIVGYEIQYSESSDNSTWGSWIALTVVSTTETFGSLTVSPSEIRGYYRRFRVRTRGSAGESYYSTWRVSSNSVRRNSWPIKPTSVTASPAAYTNENITITWSGASSPTSAIKGYMIARRTSTDNATWSSWSALDVFDHPEPSGSRVVVPLYIPGIYLQYGVWTIDIFEVYSSEEISNSVFCALTACGAPTYCDISAALAEGSITLSWSGASGGVGNPITAYEVQYSDSADNISWGSWTALDIVETTETYGSLSVAPPDLRGNYRKFRVRARGTIGEAGYSGWTESSGSVRRKRLPPAPEIAAPADGSSTFNTSPRVLISTGVEPDGQTQIVEVKFDSGEWHNSVDDAELFSESGELGDNAKTVFMGVVLEAGDHTVSVRCYDGTTQTRSAEVARTFTVLDSPFEVIIANISKVKASHMHALRSAVNHSRQYYGFDEAAWESDIIAGKTYIRDWPYHIFEIRENLAEVISLLRLYGGTSEFGLPGFEWIDTGLGRPRADVIYQLQSILLSL